MSRFRDWKLECKVYVGELGNHTDKEDLERLFEHYGPLKNVWVARSPPGFAFVEFENRDDAEDAVAELDGTKFNSKTIRVEMSSGRSRDKRRGGGGGRGGFGGGGRSYGGRDGGSRRYSGGDRSSRRSRSRSPRRDRRSRSRSRSGDRHRSPSPN